VHCLPRHIRGPSGILLSFALAVSCGCIARRTEPGRYYDLGPDVIAHLRRLHEGAHTRPKTILNLGDSISASDCFVWHERTRLDRPGMLSSEGYIYLPKD